MMHLEPVPYFKLTIGIDAAKLATFQSLTEKCASAFPGPLTDKEMDLARELNCLFVAREETGTDTKANKAKSP